jgi:hypothetical protein
VGGQPGAAYRHERGAGGGFSLKPGDYDPTVSLEFVEAERDVEDAQRLVDAIENSLRDV